jgi:hypothetical protein
MNREDRSQFISAYSKVLTQAWADDKYMQKVRTDAAGALRDAGLKLPANVKVNVKTQGGTGTLEDQVKLFEDGSKKGSFDLYIPAQPSMKDGELSDQQLESIAGGSDCCCCCTPSCTCT